MKELRNTPIVAIFYLFIFNLNYFNKNYNLTYELKFRSLFIRQQ